MATVRDRAQHRRRLAECENLQAAIPRYNAIRPEVLDSVARYLDPRGIPMVKPPVAATDCMTLEVAVSALLVISSCETHLPHSPRLVAKLVELWPDIWQWCEYLLTLGGLKSSSCAQQLYAMTMALSTLAKDNQLRRLMIDQPGSIRKISSYWLETDSDLYTYEERKFLSLMLHSLLQGVDDSHPALLEIVQAASGCYTTIARSLKRRILQHLGRQPLDLSTWDALGTDVGLLAQPLNAIGLDPCSPILPPFLSIGGLPTIIDSLSALNKERNSTRRCILTCFCVGIIRSSFSPEVDGRVWLLQAIERGVLNTVLDASESMIIPGNEFNSSVGNMFFESMYPYLVYRSVIHAFARQLRRRPYHGLVRGPMQQRWSELQRTLESRQSLRLSFDTSYCRICDNSACRRISSSKSAMMQCSACKGPRYCSVKCQRDAWLLHKQECTYFCRQIERWDSSIPRHEYDFVLYVAEREITAHVGDFNLILTAEYRSVLLGDLCFYIDFSGLSGPRKFSIKRLDEVEVPTRLERATPSNIHFAVQFCGRKRNLFHVGMMSTPAGLVGTSSTSH